MFIRKGGWSPKLLCRMCPTHARRLFISFALGILGCVVLGGSQADSFSHYGLLPGVNPEAQLRVMVRDRGTPGDPVEVIGDWVVNPSQEWQFRVTTDTQSFVYVVGYTHTEAAKLLWPGPDNLSLGRMVPWVSRSIPGEGSFLQASQLAQYQKLLVLLSENELSEISSTLVRIEAYEGETSAVQMVLQPHSIEVVGRALTVVTRHTEKGSTSSRGKVLTASGDRIRSLLDADVPSDTADLVVVVEQKSDDEALPAEDDVPNPSITERVKSWFSFAIEAVGETEEKTLPADNATLSEQVSESWSNPDDDPQLQGLSDALALDVPSLSTIGDEVSDLTNQTTPDATDEVVLGITLPIAGLHDLLPPINRGGALPTLRFPGPRVSPPGLSTPDEETVNIATAIDDIDQFLLDVGSDDDGLRELVALAQPLDESIKPDRLRNDDGEGKVDQLLGKLFWCPKRRTTSAARTVISAVCSALGSEIA